jgi:hypothetical protein
MPNRFGDIRDAAGGADNQHALRFVRFVNPHDREFGSGVIGAGVAGCSVERRSFRGELPFPLITVLPSGAFTPVPKRSNTLG